MPITPIALQVQPPGEIPNPLEQFGKYLTLRQMLENQKYRQLEEERSRFKFGEEKEAAGRARSFRELLGKPGVTNEQLIAASPELAYPYLTSQRTARKAESEEKTAGLTQEEKQLKLERDRQQQLADDLSSLWEVPDEERPKAMQDIIARRVFEGSYTPEEAHARVAKGVPTVEEIQSLSTQGYGQMHHLDKAIRKLQEENARLEQQVKQGQVALLPTQKREAEAKATTAEQVATGTQPETRQQRAQVWREPGGLIGILDDPDASPADKLRAQAGLQHHLDLRRAGAPTTITPNQMISNESKLRDDYRQESKTYVTVRDAYNKIVSAAKSGTPGGDIGLVYGFMKMQDPGSTVREGEFATAQNAGGIPERIRVMYNKAINGERLDPKIRADFVQQAQNIYDQSYADYQKTREMYSGIARRGGMDERNVVPDYSPAKPTAKAPPGTGGGHLIEVNGKRYRYKGSGATDDLANYTLEAR